MRLVFGLILIAGLGLAGMAVYMAQNYIGAYQNALAQERAKSSEAIPMAQIWVATKPISHGERITRENTRLAPWPQEILPADHFDSAQKALFRDGEQPRVAIRAMDQFEAIRATNVSAPGGDAGLTSRLKKGERAFAIKVDVASGVSGFLRPGDRVDVYWTGRLPGRDGEFTKLIQTGVRLIAIDQTVSESNEATIARTVTVAASPEKVAALAQAQSTGRLSLSLLSEGDDTVAESIEMNQDRLLGIEESQPVERAERRPEVCTIRTRKGSEVVDIPIPCTN